MTEEYRHGRMPSAYEAYCYAQIAVRLFNLYSMRAGVLKTRRISEPR